MLDALKVVARTKRGEQGTIGRVAPLEREAGVPLPPTPAPIAIYAAAVAVPRNRG